MADISALPETLGEATSLDQLVVYNESASEGSRIVGIAFDSASKSYLNGDGQFVTPESNDINPFSEDFTETDLTNHVLTIPHELGRLPVGTTVYNDAVPREVIYPKIEADTTNIILTFINAIPNTYTVTAM